MGIQSREVRELLDQFRRERRLGKRLALSAMVLSTEFDNRRYGLDVARWVRQGLIGQLGICNGPAAHTSGEPADLAWFRRITHGTHVKVHPGLVAWALPTLGDVLRQARDWLDGGADGLLFWDPNAKVKDGAYWPAMSRMGHVEEVRARLVVGTPPPFAAFIHGAGDEPASRWSAWSGF